MAHLSLSPSQCLRLENDVCIFASYAIENHGGGGTVGPDELLAIDQGIRQYVRLIEALRTGEVPSDLLALAQWVARECVDSRPVSEGRSVLAAVEAVTA